MQNVQNSESLPVYGHDDPPSYSKLFNKEASPQNQRVELPARPHTVVQVVVREPSSAENNEESRNENPPESNKNEVTLVCFGLW